MPVAQQCEQPTVSAVTPGSPAHRAGLAPGDCLLAVDGRPAGDIIDWRIAAADEKLTLVVSRSGRARRVRVTKDPSEPLGLSFDPPTITPVIRCRNRCVFCFVDQNPPGLRPSLSLKDDDYRLSFLYGNFITLNHLTPKEMERILKLRLAPLYVSVHSTDPGVRRRLFRSPGAARGLENLRRLARAGLPIHAQAVLCPGYNTGVAARQTVLDLASLGTAVRSLALVPVGLTAHRQGPRGAFCDGNSAVGFPDLAPLSPAECARLVEEIAPLQKRFRASRGSRFVFLSDEIYATAGVPYPGTEAYENFPQLENGVGLARLFLQEVEELGAQLPPALPRPLAMTLVTGSLAAPLVERLRQALAAARGLETRLLVAENRFFGPPVTAAGLLAGSDLAAALRDGRGAAGLGEAVFIPPSALKDGAPLFLDGTTREDLEKAAGVPVRAARGPAALAAEILTLAQQKPAKQRSVCR